MPTKHAEYKSYLSTKKKKSPIPLLFSQTKYVLRSEEEDKRTSSEETNRAIEYVIESEKISQD